MCYRCTICRDINRDMARDGIKIPKEMAKAFISFNKWDKVCLSGQKQDWASKNKYSTIRAQAQALRVAVAHEYYMDNVLDGWLKSGIITALFLSCALMLNDQMIGVQLSVWSFDTVLTLLYASTAMEQAMTLRAWNFALFSTCAAEHPVQIGRDMSHKQNSMRSNEVGSDELIATFANGERLPMAKFLHEEDRLVTLHWHNSKLAVGAARCLLDLASEGVRLFAERESVAICAECLDVGPG